MLLINSIFSKNTQNDKVRTAPTPPFQKPPQKTPTKIPKLNRLREGEPTSDEKVRIRCLKIEET